MSITTNNGSSLASQRLLGRVAVVTGGASGIGEHIVRLFHKHGAKVCIVDIQDKKGQQLSESLPNTCYFHCNVSIEDEMRGAIDFTVDKFGTLDILVNNAGILEPPIPDIRDFDISMFERTLDVNTKGTFIGMKHAARIMIPKNKGTIISMCSLVSIVGGIAPHAYTASKNGILGLTKSVAAELGKYGIRVNCVSPYGVMTEMSIAHLPKELQSEEAIASIRAFNTQTGNLKGVELTEDDVANAVLFLACDDARYVSGSNLVVDGGFSSVNHPPKMY